jgi:hypothetical protein
MKIILFGGATGTPISDYFKHRERNVMALINTLKHQKISDEEIRRRILADCSLEKINIDFNSRTLEILSERKDVQKVNDFPRQVDVALYRQKVPFTGARDILERTPIDSMRIPIFHGEPRIIDIQGKYICTTFEARKDFQPQMENIGRGSLGDYYENQTEINLQIQKWNDGLSVVEIRMK